MRRFLSLLSVVLLQGCVAIDGAAPAAISDSDVSEVKVVIRNGSSRELYAGTLPLTLSLKPGSDQGVGHPHAVQIELLMPKQSRKFVLHHGRTGWSVDSGEAGGRRSVPNGVLLVSSHELISTFSADELPFQTNGLSPEYPVGRDELIVMLTDSVSGGLSRHILSTCSPRTTSC